MPIAYHYKQHVTLTLHLVGHIFNNSMANITLQMLIKYHATILFFFTDPIMNP